MKNEPMIFGWKCLRKKKNKISFKEEFSMIKDKKISILKQMGFVPVNGEEDLYKNDIQYQGKVVNTVTVDFNKVKSGEIDWGQVHSIGRKTSSILSKNEFFVQLYWFIYLIQSGYPSQNISIEEKVQLGRKTGYIDLVVFDRSNKPFLVLDAKTPGDEYDNNRKLLSKSEGQIASYFAYSNNLKFVGVITAQFSSKFIAPTSFIVSTDQWKAVGSVEEYHNNNSSVSLDNAFLISPQVTPYSSKNILLKPQDLIDLTESSSSKMFHDFLTILRKHGISDKTNAFNKVLNLFIAKIVDEFNTPDNEYLKFQVYSDESLEDLNSRIESLYAQGLRNFIKISIDTDMDLSKIKELIQSSDMENAKELWHSVEHLQSKTNSNFQFKDVYDDQTYQDNLRILKELVNLIAPYKLKYAKKQQFLGDFFENILSSGFKQEAGQFFTPIPLATFMVSSLPLRQKLKSILQDTSSYNSSRQLLPRMIDFACGSGHFLTEYMNQMQLIIKNTNRSALSQLNKRHFEQFINDPFEWSKDYVYGLDIDYRLVKTSKVSSFLNGDGDAIIRRANGLDSFTSKNFAGILHLDTYSKSNQQFDVLIANPPYHVDEFKSELPHLKQDFSLGKYVTDSSSEIEAFFIERASQLLKPSGYMAIVLPSAILNTENKIYVAARKLLLKKFKVVGIMKNPNKATFSATKVETVTIFAQRRNDNEIELLENKLLKILNSGNIQDVALNHQENYLTKYLHDVFGPDFSLADYNDLLNGNYKGENINAKDYSKQVKKSNMSKNDYILQKELQRLLLYCISDNQSVIIQTPSNSMTDSLELLGYKFSGRRGHEGIHPRIKHYSIEDLTLLYGNKGTYLNQVIRAAFEGKAESIQPEESTKPYYRIKNLQELIDFNVKNNDYKVMISRALTGRINDFGSKDTIFLSDEADLENGTSISSTEIQPGRFPVIAGGREPAYYCDQFNREGDVITISQSGAYAGYISYHHGPIFASDCFTIKAKQNSHYTTKDLYYLLKSKQEQIYAFATGSIQKHVYSKNMERFRIPDYKKEPQKVLNTISSLKEKMNLQLKASDTINELQVELNQLSDQLIDKENKTFSLSSLENENILYIKGGKRIPKDRDYAPFRTNHIYPGVANFTNNTIDLVHSKTIDDPTFETIKRYQLHPNDVFISAAGTIGKVGMLPKIDKDITVSLTENAHKIVVTDDHKVKPKYLMYILSSNRIQDAINKTVTKTGTPKLSISSLGSIRIPLPSVDIQNDFINKCDTLKHEIDSQLKLLN